MLLCGKDAGSQESVASSSHTGQGTNQLFLQKLPGCLSSWQHLAVRCGDWGLLSGGLDAGPWLDIFLYRVMSLSPDSRMR